MTSKVPGLQGRGFQIFQLSDFVDSRFAGAALAAACDVLLPPQCPTCNQSVSPQHTFCGDCFRRVGFITAPCCDICGVMFAYAEQYGREPVCTACRATPPAFSRARAAFRYDGHSRQLILPFKHGDRTDTCTILATHMVRAGHALIRDAAVLIPVPLHRRRLFERRYNQAALLARSIARVAKVRVLPDGLVRDRPTQPMGDKTAAERRAELKGAFAVPPHRSRDVAGRSVLLIDDVMTSSATADACAAALKAAGAADIAVLVAARVPDPRQIQENRSAAT